MSFLHNVRLVFNGRFQADVSTVNNDVRHFDNSTFEAAFQEFQTSGGAWNGWWNPPGSGAFRLLNCKLAAVHYRDGTSGGDDSAIGLTIAGSEDQTSGKLVDVDPQWQLASAPWGFAMRLTDGEWPDLFAGAYHPHAFRDLWLGRMLNAAGQPGGGDGYAAATFQSVLTNVRWADDLSGSRALEELKQAASGTGMLSVRMTTLAYSDRDPHTSDFATGTVTGVIGPQLVAEPESYIAGRRFAPASGTTSWNGCSYCSGYVDRAGKRVFLDLSNALQLKFPGDASGQGTAGTVGSLNDIGTIRVGILRDPTVTEFTPATSANFLPIGQVDYRQNQWLLNTGGVVSLPLGDEHLRLIEDRPLALAAATDLNAGTGLSGEFGQIAIRETTDGLFVEAEPIVHRIDAPGSSTATIRVLRYGLPLPGAEVQISQVGRMPNQGGGDPGATSQRTPIPDIGVPVEAVQLTSTLHTGPDGCAALEFTATDPGNPRGYIDGQIYLIDFRLPTQGNQARSSFDYVVLHVRDVFNTPQNPTWDDIAPIMTRYANLYPVMSRGLLDLSSQADVERHAKMLRLSFTQPLENPNHMPVTRDLSQGKRDMILRYLEGVIQAKDTPGRKSFEPVTPRPAPAPPREPLDHLGGKTIAARHFARPSGLPPLT